MDYTNIVNLNNNNKVPDHILLHVGRVHLKIKCKDNMDQEMFEKFKLENEFGKGVARDLLDLMEKKNPKWEPKWSEQTRNAIATCDYFLEMGYEDTPVAPENWHLRFGEEAPMEKPMHFLIVNDDEDKDKDKDTENNNTIKTVKG